MGTALCNEMQSILNTYDSSYLCLHIRPSLWTMGVILTLGLEEDYNKIRAWQRISLSDNNSTRLTIKQNLFLYTIQYTFIFLEHAVVRFCDASMYLLIILNIYFIHAMKKGRQMWLESVQMVSTCHILNSLQILVVACIVSQPLRD